MLRLTSTAEAIPGGYSYIHHVTGVRFGTHYNLPDLLTEIHTHDRANNLPLTSREDVEHQICLRMPTYCTNTNPPDQFDPEHWSIAISHTAPTTPTTPSPTLPPMRSMRWEDVRKATRTLGRWVLGGRKRVPVAQSAVRAAICLSCPHHAAIDGCTSCALGQLRSLVEGVVGVGEFPGYEQLQGCDVCGCSLRAKVQIPVDFFVLEHSRGLPEHCWITQELAPTTN